MKITKKFSLLILILFGIFVPFIRAFVVIEMFFLLIPFVIIFLLTLFYLIVSLFKKEKLQNAVFSFSILPLFLFSQIFSSYVVKEIQKFRSEKIITEIEKIKFKNGNFPENFESSLGISYSKNLNSDEFEIQYSSGFIVTEIYNSKSKKWESRGWRY